MAGITEESRPERVAAAMPAFQALVQQLQKVSGVSAEKTTLIGFSQGSIIVLESSQRQPTLAGHAIAFSGRFATAPAVAPKGTVVHLIHGEVDPVISVENSRNAAKQLQALGTAVSLDIEPGMSHGINARMMALALEQIAWLRKVHTSKSIVAKPRPMKRSQAHFIEHSFFERQGHGDGIRGFCFFWTGTNSPFS